MLSCLAGLRAHRGATVVLKFGGNAMVDRELKASFARSVVLLRYAGLRPVVVHGGGPQIDAHLSRIGVSAPFAGGLRVTTPEVMDEVRMVLAGRVQRELVGLLNAQGPFAVGLTGEDAGTLAAVRRWGRADGRRVDLGRVGEVAEVRTGLLDALLADGRIPVLSSIAPAADRSDGAVYNVNADTAAAAVAGALGARALLMLTDVPGLYRSWPPQGGPIGQLTAGELARMLPGLAGGMVPKMAACLAALRAGVGEVRVLDGREPDAVLRAFGPAAPGTRVVRGPEAGAEVVADAGSGAGAVLAGRWPAGKGAGRGAD
ncbi:acetylglutamate kinase [Kitasatospora fiedleri]|uniref:acetylglutamate kinase n=1 Tax=Kitasatospora fiedleri TaxID=2991545 RepID=UPI00249B2451|nr:acetylglutamate kinase [Kitasatospora fiedleri]